MNQISHLESYPYLYDTNENNNDVITNNVNQSYLDKSTWSTCCNQNEDDVISISSWSECKSSVQNVTGFKKYESDIRKPLLPPCVVCGVTSSGFHYGANTCEACKGFFRRNSKKSEVPYKCKCRSEEQDAWKRGSVKDGCQACRFKRCIAVGMSKEAIKLGRYTYRHKTKNIKQAKYIEALSNGSKTTFVESGLSKAEPYDSVNDIPHSCPLEEFITDDFIGSHDSVSPTKTADRNVHLYDTSLSEKEIETLVSKVTAAHLNSVQSINTPIETIKKKQAEYLELYKARGGNQFYPDTNVQMSQAANIFKLFEEKVIKAVAFAKNIPGFRDLHLDDQANLIKASRVEITLFDAYTYLVTHIDTERKVITSPWGEELHLEELHQFIPLNNVLPRYNCARRLADLGLTSQELSIFRAIITTASDRCELIEPDKVDGLQMKLVTCLQYLLNFRSRGPGTLLYKIFNFMTDLRELTEVERKLSGKMLSDWPMVSKDNFYLLKELSS